MMVLETLRKRCPYSDFSGLYCPAFEMNTSCLFVFSPHKGKYGPERVGHAVRTCWACAEMFTGKT